MLDNINPSYLPPRRRRTLRAWWRLEGREFVLDMAIFTMPTVVLLGVIVAVLWWAGNWS